MNAMERIARDEPARLVFHGTRSAELFSREIAESLEGVLRFSFASPLEGENAGFVSASAQGRVCSGQLWTRDGGTFCRELIHWGMTGHAALAAACMMRLVRKNRHGFHAFPMYFLPGQPGAGDELDGTAAIVIALVLLWFRLENSDPLKAEVYAFLHEPSSPLAFFHHALEDRPLIAGAGEFGAGMGVEGMQCNVVQNGLCRLALIGGSRVEQAAGDAAAAGLHRDAAERIARSMEKTLTAPDGGWLWCVDPATLAPDDRVLGAFYNRGFGGINGALCIQSDILGMDPTGPGWTGFVQGRRTFDRLAASPVRRRLFEGYGMWPQFDSPPYDHLTSPSYGQGYAIQCLLLMDRLLEAGQALDYLALGTFSPPSAYRLSRDSPYWFYERMLAPDFPDMAQFGQGCGALNIVNVAEPLKAARLAAGIDDARQDGLTLIPRLPPGWRGYRAESWPILTSAGCVRASIVYERSAAGERLRLDVRDGRRIDRVRVVMAPAGRRVDRVERNTASVDVTAPPRS